MSSENTCTTYLIGTSCIIIFLKLAISGVSATISTSGTPSTTISTTGNVIYITGNATTTTYSSAEKVKIAIAVGVVIPIVVIISIVLIVYFCCCKKPQMFVEQHVSVQQQGILDAHQDYVNTNAINIGMNYNFVGGANYIINDNHLENLAPNNGAKNMAYDYIEDSNAPSGPTPMNPALGSKIS